MPRTCIICAHPERKIIDAMIAGKNPYLRIATKFGLNDKTVNTHGKNHVLPFVASVELQAQAAVLARVMQYRDEVNLPLPEKAKYVENKLWNDYDEARSVNERMSVIKEIAKQQGEQARLAGAYKAPQTNDPDIATIAIEVANRLVERGWANEEAIAEAARIYSLEPQRLQLTDGCDTVK